LNQYQKVSLPFFFIPSAPQGDLYFFSLAVGFLFRSPSTFSYASLASPTS